MIYTKTGDKGETSLANGQRVAKTDARIEAYGTVDELNSWIGLLRAALQSTDQNAETSHRDVEQQIQTELDWIQNKLFNLGAALSEAEGEWISEADVLQLETWIDHMQNEIPKQRGFILPMGSETVTRSHVARTVCRRAERRMLEANAQSTLLRFINRLSDYLFVLARYVAFYNSENEFMWKKL